MRFMTWDCGLELGVRSVDAQHRALVEMIADLHTAVAGGHEHSQVISQLDDLVTHVVNHFAHEEQLMDAHHFGEAGVHRGHHEDFKARAAGLVARMKGGENVLTASVFEFLRGWLLAHMAGPDRRMSAFLVLRGAA